MRDAIAESVQDQAHDVDVVHWMGRAALEFIGKGAMSHSFDPLTLRAEPTPIGDVLKSLM